MRNFKVLGLALVAVLAMSALAASAASAGEFHSSTKVTELVGNQEGEHEFVTNTGVVVCEVAHFTGVEETTTSKTSTISPLYTECEFQELFGITVNVNGCDYVFNVSEGSGEVTIAGCNESVPYIQVGSLGTCRVRVGEQTVGTTTFAVVGNNLKVTAEATGIVYSESGLFCAGGAVNNGTYNGLSVVTGNGGESELSVS